MMAPGRIKRHVSARPDVHPVARATAAEPVLPNGRPVTHGNGEAAQSGATPGRSVDEVKAAPAPALEPRPSPPAAPAPPADRGPAASVAPDEPAEPAGDDRPIRKPEIKRLSRSLRRALNNSPTWVTSIEDAKLVVINIGLMLSLLAFSVIGYRMVTRVALTINTFAVPTSLEERGLTGQVLAQRIYDELVAVRRFTSQHIAGTGGPPVALEERLPEVQLPIDGLNLAFVLAQIRSFLGIESTTISGEVTIDQPADEENDKPAKFGIRLRTQSDGAIHRSTTPSETVDPLLRDAAIVVLQRHDPIVAAYYHLAQRNYVAARRFADIAGTSSNPKTQLLSLHVKGLVARGQNQWKEAAGNFRQVIDREPSFRQGYSQLVSVTRRFDFNGAEALANQMIAKFPNYWPGYVNLAHIRVFQRRFPEALELMEKCVKLAPRDHAVYFEKGFLVRSVGQYDEAIEALNFALDLNPTSIDAMEQIVRLQRDLGRLPEALAAATRMTSAEPTNPLGHALAARVYLDSKDYKRSEEAIANALTLERKFAPALAERGRMHTLRRAFKEAQTALAGALESGPRLSEAWEYQGDLHQAQGRRAPAIEAYRKSIEFGTLPGWRSSHAQAKLARLLEAAGDMAGALLSYERAIRLDGRKYGGLKADADRVKTKQAQQAAKVSPAAAAAPANTAPSPTPASPPVQAPPPSAPPQVPPAASKSVPPTPVAK